MDVGQVASLVTALGGGAAVASLFKGAKDMMSGKAQAELQRNRDALSLRDEAWARADQAEEETRQANITKRKALELASLYRRQLIENGVPCDKIAPWPPELK